VDQNDPIVSGRYNGNNVPKNEVERQMKQFEDYYPSSIFERNVFYELDDVVKELLKYRAKKKL
jgi:hypothetical protein